MTGSLAYWAISETEESPLVWFNRNGQEIRRESLTGTMQAPSLSRDGQRLAIERSDSAGTDIWMIDLARGTNTRLTDDPAPDTRPVLSADGTRVAFTRNNVIYLKSSSGTGSEERLVEGETTDWSPDGKFIAFIRNGDLWAVPVDGTRTPVVLVQTKGNDRRGRFSPDGRWIAYESNFSGTSEVYVQRWPPTADRVQVSANGGGSAYWRRDSQELFFSGLDRSIMVVEVTPGPSFQASPPRHVLTLPGLINNGRFVATPDGQKFLLPLRDVPKTTPITVVLNWAAGLGR